MMNLNHPFSDPGLASPNAPDNDIPGPGKFEANASVAVSEYLYGIVQDSGCVEQYGSVDENGWSGLIYTGFIVKLDKDLSPEGFELGFDLKPAYLVFEDSNGFFTYTEFDTEKDAFSKYLADLAAYESYATR